jgi:DNA-directed RNA polymerase specialized sigma24 family protein
VPAEIAAQQPLLERAAAGDREAFARLYDGQVEGVYRYLLAWSGDRAEAADLTEQVFRGALAWLPVTADGEGEAGAWLIAMARDAVAQRRGAGWIAEAADGQDGRRAAPGDAVGAVALLGDPEREVVVLRLLLGHSLAHTAHLSGYSPRAVLELQLAACQSVWELTGGARSGSGAAAAPGPDRWPPRGAAPAEEFERRLGRWEIDLTGSDPDLADALAAAGALRQAIPGYVVAPDDEFVQGLRQELITTDLPREAPPRPGTLRTFERALAAARVALSRRPWVATLVAVVGIVGILGMQALGSPAPPSTCGGRPCPAPTTAAAPAAAGVIPLPTTTTGRASSTTGSTVRAVITPASAPQAPTSAPPTTRPATTAPPTTSAPRPPTTAPPTTSPPTTAPPTSAATTTTAPPPPPSS